MTQSIFLSLQLKTGKGEVVTILVDKPYRTNTW